MPETQRMEHDASALPGDPRGVWSRESARGATGSAAGAVWLPTAQDLPLWRTPDELHRNYSVVPAWWQRWLMPMLAVFVSAILLPTMWAIPPESESLRAVIVPIVTAVSIAAIVAFLVVYVMREARFRRDRAGDVRECFALLSRTAVPVWAVFEDRVRTSSGGDNVYDLQFVFDLRVPTETLRLQRRVVEAWLDQIVSDDDSLPERFAWEGPVHGANVFGEGMRGVWIWAKGAILPLQVLGLSVEDPQSTTSLSDENVAFMRRQPKDLRRRSKITRSRGGTP